MLSRFPKTRPVLPDAYRAIYDEHYRTNREGLSPASSLSQKMEAWMHRCVASDVAEGSAGRRTLEIGAGRLNHLVFEPQSDAYDVLEPMKELCLESPQRGRVRNVYSAFDQIGDSQYDRIISIAAFEHYRHLPAIVATCGVLLAANGSLRIAIPSEGALLWKMGWTLTTGLEFRIRHGLDYGVLMRHEHLNTADEIRMVLQMFFAGIRTRFFGIGPALSFYQFFECRNTDRELCRRYLESASPLLD
ncbi:MAG TPA: class I SAM-dependent methyltransferase [Terriglobia bacterium]|nr:class I SAM-dependent methyltransferase [Terriglobia bacterium]